MLVSYFLIFKKAGMQKSQLFYFFKGVMLFKIRQMVVRKVFRSQEGSSRSQSSFPTTKWPEFVQKSQNRQKSAHSALVGELGVVTLIINHFNFQLMVLSKVFSAQKGITISQSDYPATKVA